MRERAIERKRSITIIMPSPNVAMITLMQHVKIFKNSIYCLTDFTFVAESAPRTQCPQSGICVAHTLPRIVGSASERASGEHQTIDPTEKEPRSERDEK